MLVKLALISIPWISSLQFQGEASQNVLTQLNLHSLSAPRIVRLEFCSQWPVALESDRLVRLTPLLHFLFLLTDLGVS